MKKRIYKALAVYSAVCLVLLLYYIFVTATGLGIPCIIKKITHHDCPGCGNSRALIALAHFDIKAAAGYNLFVFAELLYVLYVCGYVTVRYIKTGRYEAVVKPAAVNIAFLIMLLVWWVARNLI